MPLKYFNEKEASEPKGKLRFFDSKLYKSAEIATPPLQVARRAVEDPIGTSKMVGQTLGGVVGGPVGAIVAPTAIEAGKQAFDSWRNKKPYDIGSVGQEALVSGASEVIPRVAGNILFSKARALNALKDGVGKELSDINGKLTSNLSMEAYTPSQKFVSAIEAIQSKVKDTSGAGGQLLRRWKNILSQGVNTKVGDLIQLEKRLGDVTKFSKDNKDVVIKNSPLNTELKKLRATVSSEVERIARDLGYKNYGKLSKEVSKAKRVAQSPNKPILEKLGASGILGGLTYAATQDPMASFGISGTALAASNPEVQRALYNALEKSGVGRALTIGAADRIRKLLSEQQ